MKSLKALLSDKNTIKMVVALFIALLYLGVFFRPKARQFVLGLVEASRTKREIVATKRDWANLDSFKQKTTSLSEKIAYYEKKLPGKKEIPAILEYLSDSARKLNVRITEIKPVEQGQDTEDKDKIYYAVPILLKAECGYHQLGRFLNELERADRFMKISDIEIGSSSDQDGILDVQLIIVTYVMSQG